MRGFRRTDTDSCVCGKKAGSEPRSSECVGGAVTVFFG